MNMCFLMWCILFLPLISSANVIAPKINSDRKETTNDIIKESLGKKTLTSVNEGSSLLHDNRTMVLPKDNPAIDLKTLDIELGTNKLKPVHARKGVGNFSEELPMTQNSTIENKSLPKNLHIEQNLQLQTIAVTSKNNVHNATKVTIEPEQVEHTPKKPLVLSSEALEKNGKIVLHKTMIPLVKSSSNTVFSDQVPSPNKDVKNYKMVTKHPGLVTPIVITILVVPVFALLGYMSFTRGREAWKNRHYKRMDFLLDGMYNE